MIDFCKGCTPISKTACQRCEELYKFRERNYKKIEESSLEKVESKVKNWHKHRQRKIDRGEF